MDNFADRLLAAIASKGAAACVGLDPLIELLPPAVLREHGLTAADAAAADAERCAAAIEAFGRGIIDTVAPLVPAMKINIAFFERYYAPGVAAYYRLTAHAKAAGLVVVGDVKRGDIGHSTTQYAHAQLAAAPSGARPAGGDAPDAVTVSPYLGFDTVEPFAEVARREGKGLFVLVQTSNASAEAIQGLRLADGDTVCHRVGRIVEGWAAADGLVGRRGYSAIGAVVSPRDVPSTERLRELMPHCLFLVPGFGAQGRTADEVARCFKPDGTGALITSSREIIFAHAKAAAGADWRQATALACGKMVEAIRAVSRAGG
jgi:orotidine-5'-phosphate decarboxylase